MTYMTTNRRIGTLRWQAPELLLDIDKVDSETPDLDQIPNTKASDVYAFALVLYEVTTAQSALRHSV
jgi:hypothetical protein